MKPSSLERLRADLDEAGQAPAFVILALPRSRTLWMSRFLSYKWRTVHHDLASECESVRHFAETFHDEVVGTVETAGMLGARTLRYLFPRAKLVVVRRPTEEVIDSFKRAGYLVDAREIEERAEMLDQVSEMVGVNTLQYASLMREDACAWLFTHCLGIPHDSPRWHSYNERNIQLDLAKRFADLSAGASRIAGIKAEVAACESSLH